MPKFNSNTKIEVDITVPGELIIQIHNIQGWCIKILKKNIIKQVWGK